MTSSHPIRDHVRAFVAALAAFALAVVLVPLAGTSDARAEVNPAAATLARRAADEGIVLLKNDGGTLPLTPGREVSVFGRIQVDTFLTGYGSGAHVIAPYERSVLDGLRRNPGITINEDLATAYERWVAANPGSTDRVSSFPEMPVTDELVQDAAAVSGTAVVVIGRNAGENGDFPAGEGGYYLTSTEKDMLSKVTASFEHVVVLINSGPAIDVTWTEDYPHIDSLLYVWEGGQEMGSAVADVLSGDVNPSGRLPQTLATSIDDYPSTANFGDSASNDYAEDIFVGYRYFETFAPDKVFYPFGYGLSYTDFDLQTGDVTETAGTVRVPVTVTNTGDTAGKQVVEVYYGAPQGELGKAAKSLAAYAKTSLLQPGSSEEVTLTFDVDDMASYDDGGYTGHDEAWVLEAGDYPVYVGTSVRDTTLVHTHTEPATRVTQQLEEALAPVAPFARYHAAQGDDGVELDTTSQQTPARSVDLKQRVTDNLPDDLPYGEGDQGISLLDVYQGEHTLDDFMAQLSLKQLVALTYGAGSTSAPGGIPGNTSVYAGTTDELRDDYGIPAISTTDGPTGIKLPEEATDMPIGSMLASTWNTRLVQDLLAEIGKEMLLNGSDVLLAPGMNIQRNPLNGRNFEYFSEDPLITGTMAAAVVRGVQSQGVSATPKHFAANNQETNRKKNDSRVSERALREIYLRGFEIMVKTSHPDNIMGSYNLVNGTHAYQNYDLNTTILRGDWGYDGVLMTDWNVTYSMACPDISLTSTALSDNACRIRSGEDVVMPGDTGDHGKPQQAVEQGDLNVGEVQRSARRVLQFALDSAVFRRAHGLPLASYSPPSDWFAVDQPAPLATPELTSISADGKALAGFDPDVVEYTSYTKDYGYLPVVKATAAAGTSVSITQATPSSRTTTITVTAADGATNRYRVFWSDDPDLPLPLGTTPARVEGLKINGEDYLRFYPTQYDYTVVGIAPEDAVISDIKAPAGVTTQVTGPDENGTLTVRAESADQRREYRFTFQEIANAPRSDDFDGTELADFWTVDSPTAGFAKPDGTVQITTEPGDWSGTKSGSKNVVWQHAEGDWSAVSKITVDPMPHQNYHQIGLTVFDDEDNFLQYELEFRNTSATAGVPLRLSVKNETAASNKVALTVDANPFFPDTSGPQTMYLKVSKAGDAFSFAVSRDGEEFTTVGNVQKSFTAPKLALQAIQSAINATADPIVATYDYVHVTMSDPRSAPVTHVTASGLSRITAATDWFSLSPTFTTEESSGDSYTSVDLGGSKNGAFVMYNVDVDEPGYYTITPQIAANAAPDANSPLSFAVDVDGKRATEFVQTGGTGGWQVWKTMAPRLVHLDAGTHQLRLEYGSSGFTTFNLSALDIAPSEVDRTALADLVEQAGAKTASDYTSGTWSALRTALDEASAVLMDASATADDVDGAADALSAALDGLVARGGADLDALAATVATAQRLVDSGTLTEAGYTREAWGTFRDALAAAAGLLDDTEACEAATPEEVDALASDLDDALAALSQARRGDLAPLQDLVGSVDGIVTADYTSGWGAYESALTAAKALMATDPADVSAQAVAAATQSLQDAIDGLVPGTDGTGAVTDLRAAVATALSAQVSDRYTSDSRAALQAPLERAQQLLRTADDGVALSAGDVAAAAGPLQDALDALVETVQTDALQSLVEQVRAAGLHEGDYTAESWAMLDGALSTADSLVGSPTSQEAVDHAFDALLGAFAGLVKAVPVDVSWLDQVLAAAEPKSGQADVYTPSTWAVFSEALANATAVRDDTGATQGEVDAAAAALMTAMARLEAAPTGEEPGEPQVVVSTPVLSSSSQVFGAKGARRATATVSVAGAAAGTLVLRSGPMTVGTAVLHDGGASVRLPSTLAVGSHRIVATLTTAGRTITSAPSQPLRVTRSAIKKLKVKAPKRFTKGKKLMVTVKAAKKLDSGVKAHGTVKVYAGTKVAKAFSVKKLHKAGGKVAIKAKLLKGAKVKVKARFVPKDKAQTTTTTSKKVTVKRR